MQLTKDDVKTVKIQTTCHLCKGKGSYGPDSCPYCHGTGYTLEDIKVIDFSKFLEVRDFYEKYKESSDKLKRDYPEIFEQFWKSLGIYGSGISLRDWLFSYCFKDGLK